MKVAVITPYYREGKRTLMRCIRSVLEQTHDDVFHVLVSDGYPQDWVNDFSLHHIVLPNVGNFGDTPRAIGAAYVAGLEADAIVLLDADCWIDPNHIEKMIEVAQKGSGIVTCPRNVWIEGQKVGLCLESNGIHFNDTNCYLITKPYFGLFAAWAFKNQKDCIVGDRVFWNEVKRSNASILRSDSAINYESDYAHHYKMFDMAPPPESKVLLNGQVRKWREVC